MAEHGGAVEFESAKGNDLPAHLRTYEGFIALAKYGTMTVAIILILMALFLL